MAGEHPRTILVVEDEPAIRRFLAAALSSAGYAVAEATSVAEALREATQRPPDAVLLDLGLPDGDGMDALRSLREWSSVPVIVVSARGQERDRVAALDLGADDFVAKPFGIPELLARLRVAFRHAARVAAPAAYEVGDVRIDFDARRVFVRGDGVKLTNLEYKLLAELARHAGKVLTHRHLLRAVWGPGAAAETHYLRVFMANLRKKLEADPAQPRWLLTEQGVGYRMADE